MATIDTRNLKLHADSVSTTLEEIDSFNKMRQKAKDKLDDGIKAAEKVAKKLLDSLKKMQKEKKDSPSCVSNVIKAIDDEKDMRLLMGINTGFTTLERLLPEIETFVRDKNNKKIGVVNDVADAMKAFEKSAESLEALAKNVPTPADLKALNKELSSKLGEVEREAERLLEQLGELPLGRVD